MDGIIISSKTKNGDRDMNKETKQYPSSNHHCEHIMQYYRNNLKTNGALGKVK